MKKEWKKPALISEEDVKSITLVHKSGAHMDASQQGTDDPSQQA